MVNSIDNPANNIGWYRILYLHLLIRCTANKATIFNIINGITIIINLYGESKQFDYHAQLYNDKLMIKYNEINDVFIINLNMYL